MERLSIQMSITDIMDMYKHVQQHPPEGAQQKFGFEQLSNDGVYILEFFIEPNGDIEINVRPPRGSYEALNGHSYAEIAEGIVGNN